MGLWHAFEKKPFGPGLLAAGTRDEGRRGTSKTAVALAVCEAMVLAAEGFGAAWFSALVEEEAGARVECVGMMSGTEGLAGTRATRTSLALVDGGAEARHADLQQEKRVADGDPSLGVWGRILPVVRVGIGGVGGKEKRRGGGTEVRGGGWGCCLESGQMLAVKVRV